MYNKKNGALFPKSKFQHSFDFEQSVKLGQEQTNKLNRRVEYFNGPYLSIYSPWSMRENTKPHEFPCEEEKEEVTKQTVNCQPKWLHVPN